MSRSLRAAGALVVGLVVGVGVGVGGGAAASLGEAGDTGGGALWCSVFDLPSWGSGSAVRSTPVEGAPYVLVCEDDGVEVVNELFVYGDPTR